MRGFGRSLGAFRNRQIRKSIRRDMRNSISYSGGGCLLPIIIIIIIILAMGTMG